jgi:hypothetical protein
MMLLADEFFASTVAWKIWYVLLAPAWLTLIFAPRSRLVRLLFDRGVIFIFPVVYMVVFAVLGIVDGSTGGSFFFDVLATSGDFGSPGMAAGFAVTATTADLAFASVLFRRYHDLNLLVKLPLAFFSVTVGWLLSVPMYFVVRRIEGTRGDPIRVGGFEVR